ncbi:uncharacterized protein F4812DRAFT_456516 [Daldinia caldariorum]|uniref:uncharacterized protein n=1 Tax=Daldinia caldariorum TaxID=326644 RepID=UPI002007A115|nr:uncharacterized protein F4812DRAFT_456516 [Daldinia caldariorum]KAI1470505.1 hypothetical protein F4812DRAFT_456516 [Daldinia caldariorum]
MPDDPTDLFSLFEERIAEMPAEREVAAAEVSAKAPSSVARKASQATLGNNRHIVKPSAPPEKPLSPLFFPSPAPESAANADPPSNKSKPSRQKLLITSRREVPCQRCLVHYSQWAEGEIPWCGNDNSASAKCTTCKKHGKQCITPTGIQLAAGLKLQDASLLISGQVDLQAAQLEMRRALTKARTSDMKAMEKAVKIESLAKVTANERAESLLSLRTESVSQLKVISAALKRKREWEDDSVAATKRMATALEKLTASQEEYQKSVTEALARSLTNQTQLTTIVSHLISIVGVGEGERAPEQSPAATTLGEPTEQEADHELETIGDGLE